MSTMMKYSGYYGSIEASVEDNCLFGKLQFIQPLVSYEAGTVAELEAAFRSAVDDYLETCKQLGQLPEKPCKGSFNVRIGHELHLVATIVASQQGVSLNDLTRQALQKYLKNLNPAGV